MGKKKKEKTKTNQTHRINKVTLLYCQHYVKYLRETVLFPNGKTGTLGERFFFLNITVKVKHYCVEALNLVMSGV